MTAVICVSDPHSRRVLKHGSGFMYMKIMHRKRSMDIYQTFISGGIMGCLFASLHLSIVFIYSTKSCIDLTTRD